MARSNADRRKCLFLSAGLGSLIVLSLVAGLVAADWPTVGQNASRQGSVPSDGPAAPYVSWVYPDTFSDAVAAGGKLYVAAYDHIPSNSGDISGGLTFHQLDEASGTPNWGRTLIPGTDQGLRHTADMGTPTVDSGRVYFLDANAGLWCLQASDGSVLWHVVLGYQSYSFRAAPLVVGGTAVVWIDDDPLDGIQHAQLVAVDTSNGNVKWRVDGTINGGESLATDGTFVFGNAGATLQAWSLADGSHQWTYNAPQGGLSAPVVANGVVYVVYAYAPNDGPQYNVALVAVNPANGQSIWSFIQSGTDSTCCSPGSTAYVLAPAADSGLVVAAFRGWVGAFDPFSRTSVWSGSVGGLASASPVLTADSVLLARSNSWDGQPAALNGATMMSFYRLNGTQRWSLGADPVVPNGPNFLLDNGLIIAGMRHAKNFQFGYDAALVGLGLDIAPPQWKLAPALQIVDQGSGPMLQWDPAADLNMKGFQVQHSVDGSSWSTYATTTWSGTGSTTFDPSDPGLHAPLLVVTPANNYYRVLPVDRAGNVGNPSNSAVYSSGTTTSPPGPTCSCETPPPTSTSYQAACSTPGTYTATGEYAYCFGTSTSPSASPTVGVTPTPTMTAPPPSQTPTSGAPKSSEFSVPAAGPVASIAAISVAGAVAAFFRRLD